MDVYHFTDYKSYILNKIEENSHIRAYRSSLAKAAGCGRSFLSQALNSEIHLTPDHGAGLTAFWNLDDERTDYFLDLMNYERAASKPLRLRLKKKLDVQRAESKLLSKRPSENSQLTPQLKEAIYYSSWHIAAIHTLTAIPGFQTIAAIARRLEVPSSLVDRTLRDLASLGLVRQVGERWVVHGGSIHLPKESPLSTVNQISWRNQSMRHLAAHAHDGIHFTGLFALSRVDAEALLIRLNSVIAEVLTIVGPSHEEELVCFNIDYFPV
jgi:uncharacterized protein (TIGR02147 family)